MSEKEYINVTDTLFGSLKSIKDNKVIQSEFFDLLEGARAVEVSNERLDTGLILSKLTADELQFDCNEPITSGQLIAITNKLLKLFMSWLNNSSLPLTVLSCRYVQELIGNYSGQVDKTGTGYQLSIGEGVFNKTLATVVIGIGKIVGVLITIGNTVLYEEEDLTTRTMDLNFLNEVLIDEILELLENSIYTIQGITDPNQISAQEKQIVINQLQLLINLNKLPIVFNLSIDLFQDNFNNLNQINFFNDVLSNGQEAIDNLMASKSIIEAFEPPTGSFSRYIQGKLNNRNIPGELFEIDFASAFTQMKLVFIDVLDIFNKLTKLLTYKDLESFLRYDIQLRVNKFNVITRGLFQLYLIRDDQTIFGSTVNLAVLTREMMDQYNLFNCNIMNKLTWNLPAPETNAIELQLDQLLRDLEVASYQNLILAGNNRCRQRQLINKNLMIWENLNTACAGFEMSLYHQYKIFDREEIYLPITNYINHTKIELMIDYLLIGIELDLYKPFEVCSVYWYLNYLLQQFIGQLCNDLEFNKFKLAKVKATIKKKKFKNNQQKMEITMKREKLNQIIFHLERSVKYYQLFQRLVNTVVNLLIHYHHSSEVAVDFTAVPQGFLVSFDKIFKLRFKAFEGILYPTMLTFDQYVTLLTHTQITHNSLVKNFSTVKNDLNEFNKTITHPETQGWINSLTKSCVMYGLQLKTPGTFHLSRGYNEYFPKFINA